MVKILSGITGKAVKFSESAEGDALWGGAGAVLGAVAIPHTPQLLGKWSNLAYGIVMFVAGFYVDMDGVGFALLGAGVSYMVDGAVRLIFPALANAQSPAYEMLVPANMYNYA
jgi:hypothetical protein